jgi:hypothetical protein
MDSQSQTGQTIIVASRALARTARPAPRHPLRTIPIDVFETSGQLLRPWQTTRLDSRLIRVSQNEHCCFFGDSYLSPPASVPLALARDRRLSIVLPLQVIPANAQHLDEPARAIDQRINAGSVAVSPGDGDFQRFEAQLTRQEKNLRIKSPPFDFLQGKNGLDR